MDALARFEEKLEEALETSFTRLMKSPLQPVEIARRLARAMESERTIGAGEVLVPNRYEVHMSPGDYAGLQAFRQALEKRLAEYLAAHARERGFTLLSPPSVTLLADASTPDRRPRVVATLTDLAPPAAEHPQEGPMAGMTQKVPISRVKVAMAVASLVALADRRTYPLDRSVISIGRHLDNDIILDDQRVSRHHAEIVCLGGEFLLRDLGSANGTWVNGQRLPSSTGVLESAGSAKHPAGDAGVKLHDGDLVSFGGVEMIFKEKP